MSNAIIDIASSNAQVFSTASVGDVLIYTRSNTQRIHFGISNTSVSAGLSIGSNFVSFGSSNSNNAVNVSGILNVASSNTISSLFTRLDTLSGYVASFEAPQLTASLCNMGGIYNRIVIGKNTSNYNSWSIAYVHQGESAASNFLGIAPITESYFRQLSFYNIGGTGNTNKFYDYDTMLARYPVGTFFYFRYNNILFRMRFNAAENFQIRNTTMDKTSDGGKTWVSVVANDLPTSTTLGAPTTVEEVIIPGYVWNLVVTGSNVGIGTVNPNTAYGLDVDGQMRVNSNAPVTPNRPFIYGFLNNTTANPITLTSSQATGGMTVTSSTRLVAPVAGVYAIGFNSIFNNDTSRKDINIRVNGVDIVNTLSEDNLTGHHYRGGEIGYYMNANDYVEYANPNSGTIWGSTWSTFWFFLLG